MMAMTQSTCGCGCGHLAKPGNTYILGHHRRGFHQTTKTKKKIARSVHRKWQEPGYKDNLSLLISAGNRQAYADNPDLAKENSDSQRGKLSWRWRGVWDRWHPFVDRLAFRSLHDQVLRRGERRCILCSSKRGAEVHHVVPIRLGYRDKRCDSLSNLVTLCAKHHRIETSGRSKGKSVQWKKLARMCRPYLKARYRDILLEDML